MQILKSITGGSWFGNGHRKNGHILVTNNDQGVLPLEVILASLNSDHARPIFEQGALIYMVVYTSRGMEHLDTRVAFPSTNNAIYISTENGDGFSDMGTRHFPYISVSPSLGYHHGILLIQQDNELAYAAPFPFFIYDDLSKMPDEITSTISLVKDDFVQISGDGIYYGHVQQPRQKPIVSDDIGFEAQLALLEDHSLAGYAVYQANLPSEQQVLIYGIRANRKIEKTGVGQV